MPWHHSRRTTFLKQSIELSHCLLVSDDANKHLRGSQRAAYTGTPTEQSLQRGRGTSSSRPGIGEVGTQQRLVGEPIFLVGPLLTPDGQITPFGRGLFGVSSGPSLTLSICRRQSKETAYLPQGRKPIQVPSRLLRRHGSPENCCQDSAVVVDAALERHQATHTRSISMHIPTDRAVRRAKDVALVCPSHEQQSLSHLTEASAVAATGDCEGSWSEQGPAPVSWREQGPAPVTEERLGEENDLGKKMTCIVLKTSGKLGVHDDRRMSRRRELVVKEEEGCRLGGRREKRMGGDRGVFICAGDG